MANLSIKYGTNVIKQTDSGWNGKLDTKDKIMKDNIIFDFFNTSDTVIAHEKLPFVEEIAVNVQGNTASPYDLVITVPTMAKSSQWSILVYPSSLPISVASKQQAPFAIVRWNTNVNAWQESVYYYRWAAQGQVNGNLVEVSSDSSTTVLQLGTESNNMHFNTKYNIYLLK